MNRVVMSCLLLSLLAISSCKPKKVPPPPPVPVNIYTVKTETVLYYDKFPSTTQALSQVDIRPEVQGYITAILFKEGDHVKKGQVLYEIDKRLYQAAYDQAVANLNVAKGTQEQAQQDADRYTFLHEKDAVAKQLYDHAIITLQNSKNQVGVAEQQVSSAKTNLSYSVITAPFDGTIGFSQVKLGNMVSVGTTILNTISTDDPMAVDFLINEAQLPHFRELENGKGKIPDSLFTIMLADHSLYPLTGKISVIDRAVDPQTGTVRIRLEFRNPNQVLRAGMSCVVRVHNQEATPQLVIPNKAVVEQMGEYFVFVIKDTIIQHADTTGKKEKGDKAEEKSNDKGKEVADTAKGPQPIAFQRKVMLGQVIDQNVIVKSGLEEGERIVIDGVQSLHEGSKVSITVKPVTQVDSMRIVGEPRQTSDGGGKKDKKKEK